MGALLRIILYGLIIYYLAKTIGNFVMRLFGVQQQHQQYKNDTPAQKEGEIHIDYVPKNKGNKEQQAKDGDYIDYEEVD